MAIEKDSAFQAGHELQAELSPQSIVTLLMTSWRIFVLLSVAGAALAFAVSFLLSKQYDVTVLLSPRESDSSVALGGLSSQIASIASLAGVGVGSGANADVGVAVLKSGHFIRQFIESRKLLPVLFPTQWNSAANKWAVNDQNDIPTINDGTEYFQENILRVRDVARSNLIDVTISWSDPAVAAEWAADLVSRLNSDLQHQAIAESEGRIAQLNLELTHLEQIDIRQTVSYLIAQEIKSISAARAQSDYAFAIVDPPFAPDLDDYSFPNRIALSALGGLTGFFAAAFMALMGRTFPLSRSKISGL